MITPTQVKQITPNSASLVTPTNKLENFLAANRLQVGQLLKAVVSEQLSNSSFLLSIGQAKVTAETKLPLRTGAELQLKVVQTGDQPLLKVLTAENQQQVVSKEALRQILPKQQAIAEFFANLRPPVPQNQQHQTPLAQQALQTLQALQAGAGARVDIMTPEGVKKLLQNSGLFFESKLATTNNAKQAEGDFKGNLLQLLGLLGKQNKQTNPSTQSVQSGQTSQSVNADKTVINQTQQLPLSPKQTLLTKANNTASSHPSLLALFSGEEEISKLRQQVESAIARVQLNQLNSLPVNEQEPQAWLFELPIKDKETTDVFSLKIAEEENQEDLDEQKRWAISLSFDLAGLGNMHARISLTGEKVSASLWAEEDQTFDLLTANLDHLRERLEDAAFFEPRVKSYQGKPDTQQTEVLRLGNYNELINIEV